jgi:hypothetical protein
MPKMPVLPMYARILYELLAPISMLEQFWIYINAKVADTTIKNPNGPSTDRIVRLSNDFSKKEFKKSCKLMKCSFNDATIGIIA